MVPRTGVFSGLSTTGLILHQGLAEAAAATCIRGSQPACPCRHMGKARSSGAGAGRRRTGTRTARPAASHGLLYSFGLDLPPCPAWQPGTTWTCASRKQMPFQPLVEGSGAGGWRSKIWGAMGLCGRRGASKAPSMGQEKAPPLVLQRVRGQGGSKWGRHCHEEAKGSLPPTAP